MASRFGMDNRVGSYAIFIYGIRMEAQVLGGKITSTALDMVA